MVSRGGRAAGAIPPLGRHFRRRSVADPPPRGLRLRRYFPALDFSVSYSEGSLWPTIRQWRYCRKFATCRKNTRNSLQAFAEGQQQGLTNQKQALANQQQVAEKQKLVLARSTQLWIFVLAGVFLLLLLAFTPMVFHLFKNLILGH